MDRKHGKDRDEIMEDFADDILGKDANPPLRRMSHPSKSHGKTIILWAVGILILIGIINFFFGGGSEVSKKQLDSVFTKLNRLEQEAEKLKGLEDKIAQLEKENKNLQTSASKRKRSIGFLQSQIKKLNKKIDGLQTSLPSKSLGTKPADAKQEKQKSPTKGQVYEVRPGDSLYSIARKYGISIDELCRINNINKRRVLQPGQKLKVPISKGQ
jgi:LysM repeat protein